MFNDELKLHTDNARNAAAIAARLHPAVAEEGLKVTASGNTVTIGFANPVLAGIVGGFGAVCRAINGLAGGVASLLGARGMDPKILDRSH